MDVGKGWAELAVSVPAAQHELVETLRTHSWLAQIHLQQRERGVSECGLLEPADVQVKAFPKLLFGNV